MNDVAQVHFCDVTVGGERWPVFGWTIATAAGTVLVDTGMIDWPELGDVTYSMRELIDGATESIRRVHALRPRRVHLAHHERPWIPEYP